MKKILLMMLTVGLTYSQTSSFLKLQTGPPNTPRVNVNVTGRGGNTYYYWVIANYPIGKVIPNYYTVVYNAPSPSVSTPITLTWTNTNATSYDVVRATSPTFPVSGATSALAIGLSVCCGYVDNGGALNPYTYGVSPGTVSANLVLDNTNYSVPKITLDKGLVLPYLNLQAKTFSQLTSLTTAANGDQYYCPNCVIDPTCAAGGTGAIASRLNNTWVCGSAGGGTGTVTSTGVLTATALVTGNAGVDITTPVATATMDGSGNISTPGTISSGVGGITNGTMDIYPASDAVNYIGMTTPARTNPLRLSLPVTDPLAGQVLSCGVPVANVSTCTWSTISGSGVAPTFNAYASRPACNGSNTGGFFYANEVTNKHWECNGATWQPIAFDSLVTEPPLAATWTALNGASVVDNAGTLEVSTVVTGAANTWSAIVRAVPAATPYTLETTFTMSTIPVSNNTGACMFFVSSTNDGSTGSLRGMRFGNNAAGYGTSLTLSYGFWNQFGGTTGANMINLKSPNIRLKYYDDGTNRHWYYSTGGTYKEWLSEARTTGITAAYYGVGCTGATLADTGEMTMYNWKVY